MAGVRSFLETAIASALDHSLLSEHELLTEVTVLVLVANLEAPVRARLLAACLKAERVNAELFVRTVGVGELCESLPLNALWRVVAIAGERASSTSPELPSQKRRLSDPVPVPIAVSRTGSAASARSSEAVEVAAVSPGLAEGTSDGRSNERRSNGRRKPNRRASGAGATSRRLRGDSVSPSDAMFIGSSKRQASSRAATEPGGPIDDERPEIEIVDETAVGVPLDRDET